MRTYMLVMNQLRFQGERKKKLETYLPGTISGRPMF